MKFKRVLTKIAIDILDARRVQLRPALSRARNKFVSACIADHTQYNKDRNEIIMHYVPKDENDNPIWGDDNKQLVMANLTKDEKEDFAKEMNNLLKEDFIFEKNEINKPVFDALRIILANLDIVFKSEDETYFYDQFCDMLEISLEDGLTAVTQNLT